jgi:hypothetical protein
VPTHRLTGNDLEALLARVPAEHGPDAVIVEANKLRTGGVAGFFAKESFEVVVEVPDGTTASHRPPTGAGTGRPARGLTIDDLVAAASDGDGFEASAASGAALSATSASGARAPQRPLRAALAPDRSPPTPAAAPTPSDATSTPTASTPAAAPTPSDATTTPAAAPTPSDATTTPTASTPTLSTDGAPFADVLGRLVRDLTAEGAPAGATNEDQVAPDAPFEPFQAVRVVGPRVPSTPDVATMAPATAPDAAVGLQVATPALPRPALEPAWLAQLGVPEEVAANLLPAGDPAIELLRMLERIPRPEALPTAPGCVIAVIGERDQAQEVAEAIAGSLRLDPDGIVVAAPRFGRSPLPQERRITCAEHADDRRRAWRRRRTPTIVAVDAPVSLDPGGTSWALHLVDALEPSQVWGVVDATRKTEDVAAWNELIGGIDALAVNHLHATSSPAAILGAGIPVGLIDGRDATPARWAAMLTERTAA